MPKSDIRLGSSAVISGAANFRIPTLRHERSVLVRTYLNFECLMAPPNPRKDLGERINAKILTNTSLT